MERSENIGALALALSKAQGAMGAALKSSRNPDFNSRYADLASVWEAGRAPLADNGLAVAQLAESSEGDNKVALITVLMHESGEWISSRLTMPVVGRMLKGGGFGPVTAQSYGSTLTYTRRYAFAAIVGIYQDDDDGNAASRNQPEAEPEMDDAELARALANIAAVTTRKELEGAYFAAQKAAGRDQAALKIIIAACAARKAALVAADPDAPGAEK
jgi:hypothetical protein